MLNCAKQICVGDENSESIKKQENFQIDQFGVNQKMWKKKIVISYGVVEYLKS